MDPPLRMSMQINIKRLHAWAQAPTYGTEGAACFDLYSTDYGVVEYNDSKIFGTGLAFEIPLGYVMLVYSRSGHGFKNNMRLANCVGVIDSDYRGELMVKLTCDAVTKNVTVSKGDRIAQAMIVPVTQNTFNFAEELSDTKRGTNGGGSTGS